MEKPERRIWAVVKRIPRGCVASYGQVAAEAGMPRRARFVGRALGMAPDSMKLPWYRVINAQGRIAFPRESKAFKEQAKRLKAEGVTVRDGRVSMAEHRWRPRSEAPILD